MKKLIFIHVPKCGGTSLYPFVRNYNKTINVPPYPNLEKHLREPNSHTHLHEYPKDYLDSCFVFTFVRNPWDRLLSAYTYLTRGFGNREDKKFGKSLSPNFLDFVKNQLRLKHNLRYLHFRSVFNFIEPLDDLDFIGKVENYQKDFNTLCDKIGVPRRKLQHRNTSNRSLHYAKHYDAEARKIVSEVYARDIEAFNYKF